MLLSKKANWKTAICLGEISGLDNFHQSQSTDRQLLLKAARNEFVVTPWHGYIV